MWLVDLERQSAANKYPYSFRFAQFQCEVRMPPRKGYVIPRTGQVQATLLNPNGMVVRMFVVAYDFRDMPAMCQTFVRQRILSFDENANPGQNVDDLSASEQMKLLRYAIHLR